MKDIIKIVDKVYKNNISEAISNNEGENTVDTYMDHVNKLKKELKSALDRKYSNFEKNFIKQLREYYIFVLQLQKTTKEEDKQLVAEAIQDEQYKFIILIFKQLIIEGKLDYPIINFYDTDKLIELTNMFYTDRYTINGFFDEESWLKDNFGIQKTEDNEESEDMTMTSNDEIKSLLNTIGIKIEEEDNTCSEVAAEYDTFEPYFSFAGVLEDVFMSIRLDQKNLKQQTFDNKIRENIGQIQILFAKYPKIFISTFHELYEKEKMMSLVEQYYSEKIHKEDLIDFIDYRYADPDEQKEGQED